MGITPSCRLHIDNIIHAGNVQVDEVGTVAVAATDVVAVRTAEGSLPIRLFQLDHPYLFLVRDNQTGALLILGRCASPIIA
jgi:serpin B